MRRLFACVVFLRFASSKRHPGIALRAPQLPPNVQLQRASGPAEIMRVALCHADAISPRPLTDAVLRVANALKQPAHAKDRRALAHSADLRTIVARIVRADSSPATSVRLLGALALLGCRADAGIEPSAEMLRLLAACACARNGDELSLGEASALHWAALKSRLELPVALDARLAALPFRPFCAPFEGIDYAELQAELLPYLKREQILLSDSQGERLVPEPRLTGWWSRANVPFLYSGKEMAPTVREGGHFSAVQQRLRELSGLDYDSALINLYEHGKVGMRYHADPDQGVLWSDDTHVCSFGCTRTFVLRRVDDHDVRHEFTVEHGDCIHMSGACQDDFQHCIRVEQGELDAGPRISIVFKQSLRQ